MFLNSLLLYKHLKLSGKKIVNNYGIGICGKCIDKRRNAEKRMEEWRSKSLLRENGNALFERQPILPRNSMRFDDDKADQCDRKGDNEESKGDRKEDDGLRAMRFVRFLDRRSEEKGRSQRKDQVRYAR